MFTPNKPTHTHTDTHRHTQISHWQLLKLFWVVGSRLDEGLGKGSLCRVGVYVFILFILCSPNPYVHTVYADTARIQQTQAHTHTCIDVYLGLASDMWQSIAYVRNLSFDELEVAYGSVTCLYARLLLSSNDLLPVFSSPFEMKPSMSSKLSADPGGTRTACLYESGLEAER